MIVCLEKKAYLRTHFIMYMVCRVFVMKTNIYYKTIKFNLTNSYVEKH